MASLMWNSSLSDPSKQNAQSHHDGECYFLVLGEFSNEEHDLINNGQFGISLSQMKFRSYISANTDAQL
jgi:hypothetical protein